MGQGRDQDAGDEMIRIELPPESPGHDEIGARGEALAATYLREDGWRIVARNEKTKLGELDLVGLKTVTSGRRRVQCLAIVEVKSRRATRRGPPAEVNITAEKRQRLVRLAKQFVKRHRVRAVVRFDVIAIEFGREVTELRHHEAAFDADG